MRTTGVYQILGDMRYFIPNALPPSNPPLEMTAEIISLFGEASFALGQLDEMGKRLPDPSRFIKAYVIKEAMLSSSIEGVHTTLNQLLQPLRSEKINKDTQLVLNYTKALDTALNMIQNLELPLSTKVILNAHKVLMNTGEGEKSSPGQFRRQSVRVGDLVPPPPFNVPDLMGGLDKYINETGGLPPLIKAGLSHVQFETIHPFLDGNGRIGRLLIVLILINSNLLKRPILYPSYYFKKHHLEYYQELDRVRTHGDYEGWIVYYLKAIRDSSLDAYNRAKDIEDLERKLKTVIKNDISFTKMRDNSLSVLDFLFTHPITSIAEISQKIDKAYNTIQNILKEFKNNNIVSETILHKRHKIYRFDPYLSLLEKEYE